MSSTAEFCSEPAQAALKALAEQAPQVWRRSHQFQDFQRDTIHWRGEQDKIGHELDTPLAQAASWALLRQRQRCWSEGHGSEWVFPAPGDSTQLVSRHLARDQWERAEAAPALTCLPGRGQQSRRRKFATELKGASLEDLCALGGWKDHNTVLKRYQQPDPEATRVALETRGTLRPVARP